MNFESWPNTYVFHSIVPCCLALWNKSGDDLRGNSSCVSRFCLGGDGVSRPAGLYVISWGRGARGNGYDIYRSLKVAKRGWEGMEIAQLPRSVHRFAIPSVPLASNCHRLASPHPLAGGTCAVRLREARRLATAGRQSLAIAWTLSLPAESFFRFSVSVPRRALIYCIYMYLSKNIYNIYMY